MTISIEDDADIFLDDFGVTATRDADEFTVIFDNDFALVLDGVETSAPAATCKTSDVTDLALAHDDIITVGGTNYRITGIRDDGTGLTILILREDE